MRKTKRPCTEPGCPTLTTHRYCQYHRTQHNRQRGHAHQRGYGHQHQTQRAQLAPEVAAGKHDCWRCNQPITPTQQWHLGHHDNRTLAGPEHATCNLSAAGKASHHGV